MLASCWHPEMGLSSRMWAEEILWSSETRKHLAASLGSIWETAIPAASCCVHARYEMRRSHTLGFIATEVDIQKSWSVEGNFNKDSFTLFEGQEPIADGKHKAHILLLN